MTPWTAAHVTGPVTFRWTSIGRTVELEVCRDRPCTDVVTTTTSDEPTTTVAAMEPGYYFWRIREAGDPTWRPARGFRVISMIGPGDQWLGRPDFDGDGVEDGILSGRDAESRLFWRAVLGRRDGAITPTGPRTGRLQHAGDVDGDGYSDAVAVVDDEAHLYRGGASGLADTAATSVSVTSSTASLLRWAPLGDIDGDGYADLGLLYQPVRSPTSYRLVIWRGAADGFVPDAYRLSDSNSVLVGGFDIDRDGYADVLRSIPSGSVVNASLQILAGAPEGGPTPSATFDYGSCRIDSTWRPLGEVDGDGAPDLILDPTPASAATCGLVVTMVSDGQFTFAPAFFVDAAPDPTRWWLSADLSCDGRTDVVSETDTGLDYWVSTGAAYSTTPTSVAHTPSSSAVAADFDGDGCDDVLIGDETPGAGTLCRGGSDAVSCATLAGP